MIDKFNKATSDIQGSKGMWNLALWNESDYPQLQNNSHLYENVMKIFKEINETDKNTVIKPQQIAICINNKSFTAILNQENILPNLGMNEMAKRSTGETSSINVSHAIGTDGTTPTLADTTLGAEIARIAIGTQQVVNQTEQYSSAFTGADITSPPQTLEEAGLFTTLPSVSGILIAHVSFSPFILDTGKIFTLLTNITHQNGTQV